jgi:hypothetical protein
MQSTSTHSIHSIDIEADQPRVLYIWPIDLPQPLRIPVL